VTSSANQVVRIGVVGLGYWGPNIARNVAESPRAELSWVCDMNPEALRLASKRYSGTATTTSIEEMLDDPELGRRLGAAGAKRVSESFSAEAAAAEVLRLYAIGA